MSAEEQAYYEAGLRQLEAAEQIEFDMVELARVREQIKQAEARRQELETRIAPLKAAMSERDKQALGIRGQV